MSLIVTARSWTRGEMVECSACGDGIDPSEGARLEVVLQSVHLGHTDYAVIHPRNDCRRVVGADEVEGE